MPKVTNESSLAELATDNIINEVLPSPIVMYVLRDVCNITDTLRKISSYVKIPLKSNESKVDCEEKSIQYIS